MDRLPDGSDRDRSSALTTAGVVVDVRALQADAHASRGIGRYTVELIRAVEAVDPSLVRAYVADPAFPMHEQLRQLLGTHKLVRGDDPELERVPPKVVHVTSPFVEGNADGAGPPVQILPTWARHPDTRVVATVYDLIPARFPEVYLHDPAVAAEYRARTWFLRGCDRLLSISGATSADLIELLGVPEARVVTVHGAAGAAFVPAEGDRGSTVELGHVLCPSGAEWRKNLDRLLQAWARLDPVLQRATPLVVQCHMDPATRAAWTDRLVALGIEDTVELTGEVTEAELVAMMQSATLVVFPSLYEGLGLPVLEARRCGAAVICGDNSSLRELVEDPSARFDATDVDSIADALRRHLTDSGARRDLAARPVDDRYTWSAVAGRVVEVYRELLAAPRRGGDRSGPRLAIASPVPPQLSGPSAYMAALLEHLVDHAEITLFTTIPPGSAEVPERVRVRPLSTLDQVELVEGAFDEVLYVLGNSEFHIEELDQLRRRPGAVLLHDARLTLLYSETYRRRPDLLPETFGGALHRMYPGRYPAAMGGAQFLPMQEEDRYGILMMADVAALATRLLVHSEHAADLIELDCGRRPEVVFPIPSPPVAATRDEPSTPLVASFGFASLAKCSDVVVDAAAGLPGVEVVVVGHSGEDFLDELRERAEDLGVADRVLLTGMVDGAQYQDWLARTTVAVQLRRHTNGESSASVAETLAAGIPTVVTDLGTFSEYPDDVVVKVPAGIDGEQLAEVLAGLLADPGRRASLRRAGRAHAAAHGYPSAAETLVRTLCGTPPPAPA